MDEEDGQIEGPHPNDLAKKYFDDILLTLSGSKRTAMWLLLNHVRVVYVDEYVDDRDASTDGKSIVLFKEFTDWSQEGRLALVMHELYHVQQCHPWRAASIVSYHRDIPNIMDFVICAMDAKVDYFVNVLDGIDFEAFKTWSKFFTKDEVERLSVEEMVEKLLHMRGDGGPTPDVANAAGHDLGSCGGFDGSVLSEGSKEMVGASCMEDVEDVVRETLLRVQCAGGSLTSVEERRLDELTKPQVLWYRVFRRDWYNDVASKFVSSFLRPHRRFGDSWPHYKMFGRPRAWLFVDVSASISKSTFSVFFSEARAMTRYCSRVFLVTWDTDVTGEYDVKTCGGLDNIIEFKGGGGTRFAPIIGRYVDRIKMYDIVVCLTDGYWFDEDEASAIMSQLSAKSILVTTADTQPYWDSVIKIEG